jgi:hypothetical protein
LHTSIFGSRRYSGGQFFILGKYIPDLYKMG